MSQARIICEKCGFVQLHCTCTAPSSRPTVATPPTAGVCAEWQHGNATLLFAAKRYSDPMKNTSGVGFLPPNPLSAGRMNLSEKTHNEEPQP